MYPNQDSGQRNPFIIPLIVAALVIIFIVGLLASRQPANVKGKVQTRYDATSGETTRTIEGESNTGTAGAPVYLGAGALLDRGLSTNQLANMENAFNRYAAINKLAIKQVSISTKSITSEVLNKNKVDEVNALDFDVVLDSKTTLHASLHYKGLNWTELFLYDAAHTQLYDSGVIDDSTP